MKKYGNSITLMDAIYRTTKYGFPCFFLTVYTRTSIGTGMVIATIIPQHENEDMITEGLSILKQWNPEWSPKYSMTDKSDAELKNSIPINHSSFVRFPSSTSLGKMGE